MTRRPRWMTSVMEAAKGPVLLNMRPSACGRIVTTWPIPQRTSARCGRGASMIFDTDVVIWALGIMHGVDDPNVAATLLRHGNYDYVNQDTIWDPSITNHSLPPSLYLTSKPAWFGAVPTLFVRQP